MKKLIVVSLVLLVTGCVAHNKAPAELTNSEVCSDIGVTKVLGDSYRLEALKLEGIKRIKAHSFISTEECKSIALLSASNAQRNQETANAMLEGYQAQAEHETAMTTTHCHATGTGATCTTF